MSPDINLWRTGVPVHERPSNVRNVCLGWLVALAAAWTTGCVVVLEFLRPIRVSAKEFEETGLWRPPIPVIGGGVPALFFLLEAAGMVVAGVSSDIRGRKVAVVTFGGTAGLAACASAAIQEFAPLLGSTKVTDVHDPLQFAGVSVQSQALSVCWWLTAAALAVCNGGVLSVVPALVCESSSTSMRQLMLAGVVLSQAVGTLAARLLVLLCHVEDNESNYMNALRISFMFSATMHLALCLSGTQLVQVPSISARTLTNLREESRRHFDLPGFGMDVPLTLHMPMLGDTGEESPSPGEVSSRHLRRTYATCIRAYVRADRRDLFGMAAPRWISEALVWGALALQPAYLMRINWSSTDQPGGIESSLRGSLAVEAVLTAITISLFAFARDWGSKAIQLIGFSLNAFILFGINLSIESAQSVAAKDEPAGQRQRAALLCDAVFRSLLFVINYSTMSLPLEAMHTRVRGGLSGLCLAMGRTGALLSLTAVTLSDAFSKSSWEILLCWSVLSVIGASVTLAFAPHVLPAHETLEALDFRYSQNFTAVRRCGGWRVPRRASTLGDLDCYDRGSLTSPVAGPGASTGTRQKRGTLAGFVE